MQAVLGCSNAGACNTCTWVQPNKLRKALLAAVVEQAHSRASVSPRCAWISRSFSGTLSREKQGGTCVSHARHVATGREM